MTSALRIELRVSEGSRVVFPVPAAALLLAVTLAIPSRAEEDARSVFFREAVEPIFVRHCLECHGSDRSGGLDLRLRNLALKGGENGAAIVPGKPDESLLMGYVASGEMPPEKPLKKQDVDILQKWIQEGAWFPDRQLDRYTFSTDHRAGYDWWSLQTINAVTPRELKDVGRQLNHIDRFVLSRLQAAGLEFAPPADRATFIRRVTYDLTGLMPTAEEVSALVADPKPDVFERLVDRLLDSPHYGERWGRHWLDIARFAESNGFERDQIRRNFWPYRDYVIRSFNDDKPYDQFVLEQLAGDAMDQPNLEYRVAVGFLAAGPKNDVGTVSELERLKTRQDELDEFVIATGTTFLGLTVGCARCHDHKFDPVPAADYYALTAVFSGCQHINAVSIASSQERKQHEAQAAPLRAQIERKRKEQSKVVDAARAVLIAQQKAKFENSAAGDEPELLPAVNSRRNKDEFESVRARFVRFTIARSSGSQPCLDEVEVYGAGGDANLALASAGSKATASSLLLGFPIHRIEHLNDGLTGNSNSWISSGPTGWAQIELKQPSDVSKVVWGRDREGRYKDRVPVGYQIEVSLDAKSWTTVSDSSRRRSKPAPGSDISDKEVVASLKGKPKARHDWLAAEIESLQGKLKAIPPLPTVYSMNDSNGQAQVPVLNRGDVRSRGKLVSAAALSAVKQLDNRLTADSGPARRLKLARWITSPANPLTARVIVNRIWQNHFGRGIVDTPSDFGFKGGPPSHPKLLDWLAADFMNHGWKIKRLHKLIVLSAAYRQSSQHSDKAAKVDADNRLLWRYSPRRLEAEAVRDIILQISGKLNHKLGGPSFATFVYRDGNVPDYQLIAKPGPETWRRSIYRYNIRTFRAPLMSAFDCPDPSVSTPSRLSSTNPLQALSLLNNSFVVEQAGFMVERAQSVAADDVAAQVGAAYEMVMLRTPSDSERQRATSFVNQHGLTNLFRALVNSNEFLYVF